MASSAELEAQLQKQQADYLAKLEQAGQLPTVINNAWQQAGGAETAALRGQEADMLKNYISAGAQARQQYQNVWDPFARDTLAAKQVQLNYAPLADIRSELAMRAQALSAAQQGAASAYNADLSRQQQAIGFTQDSYNRAFQKEQAAAAAAAKAASSRGGGRGGSGKAKKADPATEARQDIQAYIQSGSWRNQSDTEKNFLPQMYAAYPELSPEQINKWTYQARKPYEETKWGKLQSFQG